MLSTVLDAAAGYTAVLQVIGQIHRALSFCGLGALEAAGGDPPGQMHKCSLPVSRLDRQIDSFGNIMSCIEDWLDW